MIKLWYNERHVQETLEQDHTSRPRNLRTRQAGKLKKNLLVGPSTGDFSVEVEVEVLGPNSEKFRNV